METKFAKGSTEGVDGCLMNKPLKVLFIEDSEYDVQILIRELRRGGYEPLSERVETARDMSAALDRQKWDLVISDYVMPRLSGLDALTLVKDWGLDLPFIIVSGNIGDDLAVESMKAGAHDYILKSNLSRLVPAIRRELREAAVRRERRQAEKAVQHLQEQNARMQRLSSLSALSAGIVHEIAQPLNSIKLLADGMLYLYEKGLFNLDDYGNNLKDISAQVDQITVLINQIRSFANVGRETEIVPCSLNRAVKRIMSFLGRQLSAHGITVKIGLDVKLPRVFGTQSGYEEVVLNLLTNAMHALDAIDNREKEIMIRTFRTGGKVVLEVSDNATGIRDEIREEIFEPLFSTKKPGEGMGLGLSIVHSIVERFNGSIEAQNKIQGGATFRVELPVACCSIKGR